jgi:hypothetical protein
MEENIRNSVVAENAVLVEILATIRGYADENPVGRKLGKAVADLEKIRSDLGTSANALYAKLEKIHRFCAWFGFVTSASVIAVLGTLRHWF